MINILLLVGYSTTTYGMKLQMYGEPMLTIHGKWEIQVSNKVVMQWFSDSWNEEAMIAYIKDFRKSVEPLIKGDWAILSVFEDWGLGVPEMEKHIIDHCAWFLANGCIKDCHVYSESSLKSMQLERTTPLKEGRYERQVFTHIDDGIKWLNQSGFEISDTRFLLHNRV